MDELEKARQQARFKLCKQIRDINQYNNQVLDRKLGRILGLKKKKPKSVDARDSHTIFYVDLHKATHHFPHCTRYLLDYMGRIRSDYTFLEMAFAPNNDWNCLVIYLFWHEFINDVTGTSSNLSDMRSMEDFSGVQELLAEMNSKNEATIEAHLGEMLSKKKTSMLNINDEHRIILEKYTFKNHFTRQEYREHCIRLRQKYPFVEIHHDEGQGVVLRVWWQIYLNPMNEGDVQLEDDMGARRFWKKNTGVGGVAGAHVGTGVSGTGGYAYPTSTPVTGTPAIGAPASEPPQKNKNKKFQSLKRATQEMARDIFIPQTVPVNPQQVQYPMLVQSAYAQQPVYAHPPTGQPPAFTPGQSLPGQPNSVWVVPPQGAPPQVGAQVMYWGPGEPTAPVITPPPHAHAQYAQPPPLPPAPPAPLAPPVPEADQTSQPTQTISASAQLSAESRPIVKATDEQPSQRLRKRIRKKKSD